MMNEKLDLLQYLAENGADFGGKTFDEILEGYTLEDLRRVYVETFGEDPTA